MDKLLNYLHTIHPISYTISGILSGTKIDDYKDTEFEGYTITVTNRGDGSGIVHLEKDKEEWSLVFTPESNYPELINGADRTAKMTEGFVKDGKLIASSLSKYVTDIKQLGNPLIDVSDYVNMEDGMRLISVIINTLASEGIFAKFDPNTRAIQIINYSKDSANLDKLSSIIGRMYYPTTREDTVVNSSHNPLHQSQMDVFTENGTPMGSVKAIEIMSNTPMYLNKELLESIPNIEPGSSKTTNQVLNSKYMTPKAFKRIKDAYENGVVDKLLSNEEFMDAWKSHDYNRIRELLGEDKSAKISDSLYKHFGIRTKDLDNIIKVEDDPLVLYSDPYSNEEAKTYNVFADPSVKSISHAKIFSDEYIKYNDIYDARYEMFTSRGERMYASGDNNYQANTILRENIRFQNTDASNVDINDYRSSLLQTIGGSLVEDGYIDTHNIKYSKSELEDLAFKYISYGYDEDNLTPRIKSQMRAYNNLEEHGVVDTGITTTLDATFSGLVVNSAITGKTNNLSKINIRDAGDTNEYDMNDLYSDVGSSLMEKLIEKGIDRKKARKLVKPGVMSAMYNSSERRRTDKLITDLRKEMKKHLPESEVNEFINSIRPEIKETTRGATEILSGTIRENDVMNLVDKGIIQVFESDNGMPREFNPKELDDLVSKTAGIRINKPDGTHTTIMNDASSLAFEDGVLIASKGDHVKPFVSTTSVKDGIYRETTNNKKFLDNVSTAIARSYDSYVASYVVEKLHDEEIPVVTTHDAFTVPVYASERTRELYNEAVNNLYEFGGSDKRVNARNNLSTE